jgi:ATP-dependent Clp protease ATP-binding subunit ClpA
MADTDNSSDFTKVIDRSYNLAMQYKHEYVVTEHLLLALLEFEAVTRTLQDMGCDCDALRVDLLNFMNNNGYHSVVSDSNYQPKYTTTLLTVIKQAKTQSMFLGRTHMTAFDVLLALLNVEQSYSVWFLNKQGVTKSKLSEHLIYKNAPSGEQPISREDALMVLGEFAVNLNQKARQGKIHTLVGRDADVDLMVETISRKFKNNVILVGYPGVGKTQLVEGLAKRIVDGQVPAVLKDQEIWNLDINNVVAGTKYRGDFEERMKNLIVALKSLPNIILFIDEIHMILGAGGGSNSGMDAANILKPALGRGEIRTIGSTTHDEFRKYFEKDRALMRRFQKQDVHEPTPEDAKRILRGILPTVESFHKVSYDADCVAAAVDLSVKYLFNKHLPDKAIDLIDAAGAAVKVSGQGATTVTRQHIEQQLAKMANVRLQAVAEDNVSKLQKLESSIRSQLFGQDHAVTQLVDSVLLGYSGLRESNKTMGAYLFTGPSGVGKTQIAKLLAEKLEYALVRLDMSEFMEKHTVSRLIGSPPGYVGYSDGSAGSGVLISAVETNPSCVLLIDEVEKAHPDVLNIFLQAMDEGMITSQTQKSVSLKNVILIFTSNLGAGESEKNSMGFLSGDNGADISNAAVRQFFAPEFRNRLDSVITFHKLSKDNMRQIVDKFINELNDLSRARNVSVVVNPSAREWLVQHGFEPSLGARPLARVIGDKIKKPMSRELLFGKLAHGGSVLVTVVEDEIKLEYMASANLADNNTVGNIINFETVK